jgi:tripartite-type tricarboxylate transporter receptor subunit TctC
LQVVEPSHGADDLVDNGPVVVSDHLFDEIMFPGLAASIEYVRAGKLRLLAVTSATRSAALPDIPTVGEFVPGYEASQWNGLGAPKNTPAEIVDKLNKEINAVR